MASQTIAAGATTFGTANAGDSFFILSGGQSVTGNVDYSGVNTSVLAEIRQGFTGQIGTSAAPWQTAFSSYLWYGAGGGDLYFEGDAADTDTTALIRHTGGGHLHLVNQGTVTRLDTLGRTTVSNGVTVTTAYCARTGADVKFLDTGTGTAVGTTYALGAHIYTQRPHTTIHAGSGRVILDTDQAGGANAHGAINIYGPCDFQIWDSGTITTLLALGAIPDISRLARPVTITNATVNMALPGAQAFLDATGIITFTNTPTRIFSDGTMV